MNFPHFNASIISTFFMFNAKKLPVIPITINTYKDRNIWEWGNINSPQNTPWVTIFDQWWRKNHRVSNPFLYDGEGKSSLKTGKGKWGGSSRKYIFKIITLNLYWSEVFEAGKHIFWKQLLGNHGHWKPFCYAAFTRAWSLRNNNEICSLTIILKTTTTKILHGLFLWIGFNCFKAVDLFWGDSLLWTTVFTGIPGTLDRSRKDERLSQPWSHLAFLKSGYFAWIGNTTP